jgi:hypothetical protein
MRPYWVKIAGWAKIPLEDVFPPDPLPGPPRNLIGTRWRLTEASTWVLPPRDSKKSQISVEFEITKRFSPPWCLHALEGSGPATLEFHIGFRFPGCEIRGADGTRTFPVEVRGDARPDRMLIEYQTPPEATTYWYDICEDYPFGPRTSMENRDINNQVFEGGQLQYREIDTLVVHQSAFWAQRFPDNRDESRLHLTPECPMDVEGGAEIPISVEEPPPPEYDNTLTKDGLTQLALHVDPMFLPEDRTILGWVRPFHGAAEFEAPTTPARFGRRVCYRVTKAVITPIGRLRLYIPSEYPPGSCNYQAVLEHEWRHVEIDRRLVEEYAWQFRAAVEALHLPPPGIPAGVDDPTTASAKVKVALTDAARPIFEKLRVAMRAENSTFDDIDRARTFAKCPTW